MVNDQENVVLTSPDGEMWVGVRGAVACTVTKTRNGWRMRVTACSRDQVLDEGEFKTVLGVHLAVRDYGFHFQPKE